MGACPVISFAYKCAVRIFSDLANFEMRAYVKWVDMRYSMVCTVHGTALRKWKFKVPWPSHHNQGYSLFSSKAIIGRKICIFSWQATFQKLACLSDELEWSQDGKAFALDQLKSFLYTQLQKLHLSWYSICTSKHMQHVLESDFYWQAGTTYLPSQAEKWQQPCTLLAVMH